MRHALPAALLLAAAACSHRAPQVVTPVPVDTARVVVESTASRPARAFQTAADDPFVRVDRMDWPGPNRYRSADGSPGPDYWQQRADYQIAATLDTAARAVSGSVTIRYTNNSPDTLRFVWLQADQNLYRPGSKGSVINPAESRWGARNFPGGYTISRLTVDGRAAEPKVNDTMMRVDLDRPIAPHGGTATIAIDYRFAVPEHGSDRMGRDSTLYEIAQWYPRMAVYDDVRGWNTDPYLGQGEFYLEYGDYEYAVTVPAGYTVAGSGVLQNASEVLSATERQRLAQAATSTTVVPIITAAESAPHAVSGTKTWRFRAQNVHDVAWAAAPDMRWDAVSTGPIAGNEKGVLCQSYYVWPRAGRGWEDAAENTQWTIRTYSSLFYPFPYPQATSVAGPVGGMEYPMFVMVHYAASAQAAFGTIDHEHGHEWYPMLVGSNERRYAWMDEGFNTYINTFSNELRTSQPQWPMYLDNWRRAQAAGTAAPLMTPPDRIDPGALGAIGYRKPAAVLLTLRNHVVGRDTFDRAFREYTRRWAFKHPTPGDFFRTIESVSGEDLSWYWRAFFYGNDVLDLAVVDVANRSDDGQTIAAITVRRTTSVPFPLEMRLKLADGSTQDVRVPVEIWGPSARTRVTAEVNVRSNVVGVRLWPDATVPDWDEGNDAWGDAPPRDAVGLVTGGGLNTSIPKTQSNK